MAITLAELNIMAKTFAKKCIKNRTWITLREIKKSAYKLTYIFIHGLHILFILKFIAHIKIRHNLFSIILGFRFLKFFQELK